MNTDIPQSSSKQTLLQSRLLSFVPAKHVSGSMCQSRDIDEIMRTILAKPWRRTSVDIETEADVRRKVTSAIRESEPIRFALPFGGYKGWRARSFPHIDWAEVFWLEYLFKFGTRIAGIYSPGVEITLSYTGGILTWMNNLPPGTADLYQDELSRLLPLMSGSGVRFLMEDHSRLYGDADSLITFLEERADSLPMPTLQERSSAARNLYPCHGQDIWTPDDPEVVQAARRCSAMLALDHRRNFNKFGPRIQITHIRGASLSLHLGSTRSSVAQPWVTSGYLEWDSAKSDWIERLANTDNWPTDAQEMCLEHPLAELFPTLHSVPILVH